MKKLLAVLVLLLLGIFVVSYSWAGEVRVWTSGKHTIEGEFVELIEGDSIVRIRKTNGKVVRVPLTKLSKEDVAYVNEIQNPFVEESSESEDTESSIDDGKRSPKPNESKSNVIPSNPKAGDRIVLTADEIEYAFRWCPPGEFMMGSDNGIDDNKPIHKVRITKGFWLLETEVTQEMWRNVMGENPSVFKGDRNPVEFVSWDDCQEFCRKLSQKLGQQIQLPTEAQWEYACRAGTTGDYAETLDEMAWLWSNSDQKTHPVGQKKPNPWGLYDMIGNVWEWCSDYYASNYYSRSPTSDPENTTASYFRVFRGEGWSNLYDFCESASRLWDMPHGRNKNLGLRVSLVPGQE